MEYKIHVGAQIKINNGFMSNLKIMYCGMPNENTFVLSPLIINGYRGFSPNIFYNVNSSVIQIHHRDFQVLEVNSEYIILKE